jgi:hypothetical protein
MPSMADDLPPGHHEPRIPAWRRKSPGEHRLPATLAVLAAIALQLALPEGFSAIARRALPIVQALLQVVLVAVNPGRIDRISSAVRGLVITLIAVASLANAWAAAVL